MKIFIPFICLITISSNSYSQWCDYVSDGREPSSDEALFCPVEMEEIEFNNALKKLSITINKVKKEYPKYSTSFTSIEKNLLDLISKLEAYTKAKCEFDDYDFLYELSPSSRGTDSGKYTDICTQSYRGEAIKEIEKVIKSCETIDKEFGLPCIKVN